MTKRFDFESLSQRLDAAGPEGFVDEINKVLAELSDPLVEMHPSLKPRLAACMWNADKRTENETNPYIRGLTKLQMVHDFILSIDTAELK